MCTRLDGLNLIKVYFYTLMRKVLIITYYWPPSGGSGVQRWLKFAKYLPEFGWEPIIVTPENPSFINTDETLVKEASGMEVLKLPIWEPYRLVNKLKRGPSHQKDVVLTGKMTLSQKVAAWIRGNLFIPDPRKFWIKPTYKFLKDFIPESDIHTIITTGPPHSLHLIGLKLKRKLGVKWVADFRDPWSEWDVLETFRLSSLAWRHHRSLERRVLMNADQVISVGWQMDKDLKRLGAHSSHVITNGFDPDDFQTEQKVTAESNRLIIRHIGSIDDQRNPRPFLALLKDLNPPHSGIEVEFVGNINPNLQNYVEKDPFLKELVSFRDYVPHSEVIDLYKSTGLLLLVLAHSKSSKLNITGKIFEYVASGTPVLGLGDPGGDAAQVLKDSGGGRVFDPSDNTGILEFLNKVVTGEIKGSEMKADSEFSRKTLTEKLVTILES